MLRSKKIPTFLSLLILVIGVTVGTTLVKKPQEIREKAAEIQSSPAASIKNLPKPITGTFVFFPAGMAFYTEAGYYPYFNDITDAGIDTVVVLAMGCVYQDAPACTSAYKEWNYFNSNLMQSFLRAAKKYNVDIYLGLACHEPACISPTSGNPDDPNTDQGWIIKTALNYAATVKQFSINQGWGWEGNFIKGFYIPQEISIPAFSTWTGYFNYYDRITDRVKARYPSKDILISPYKYDGDSYNEIYDGIRKIVRSTQIDIIAPQDSVGTTKVTTFDKDRRHYDAIRDAVSGSDVQAWANIETFYCPDGACAEATREVTEFKRLRWQIRAASERVTKMITWLYQWSMLGINTYEPGRYSDRIALKNEYLNKPIIFAAFQWYTPEQLVIKGYNFGSPGESADVYIHYRNSSNQVQKFKGSSQVFSIGKPFTELRIPMTSLSGISLSKLLEIAVVNGECYSSFYRSKSPESYPDPSFPEVVPCSTPTPTNTPTPTRKPTPTPTKKPTATPTKRPTLPPPPTITPTPTLPPVIPGDATGEGVVDIEDYKVWVKNYNSSTQGGSTNADFDDNGRVDGKDYIIWLKYYGVVGAGLNSSIYFPGKVITG